MCTRLPGLRAAPLLLLGAIGCTGSDVDGGQPFASEVAAASAEAAPGVFPLHVEPGKRYLVDDAGAPFLIHGEAAWSLIVELTREEVDLYLADRRARGVNAIMVNVLEHKFARNPPANVAGDLPFEPGADFVTPNEAYFAHVDWVIRRAAEMGFLVLLVPAYLGYEGGPAGWYAEMVEAGPGRMREYGRFLGRRYGNETNILWTLGGDYDPPDRRLVTATAEGIREFVPDALMTVHCGPETASMDYWSGEEWVNLHSVYTGRPVHLAARRQYEAAPAVPFLLLESHYESDTMGADAKAVRTQAYQALLSGAAGQLFGNNPIWHFSGPGIVPAPTDWRQALDSPGSRSMTHLWNLFAGRRWWDLAPDLDNSFIISGGELRSDQAVAAVSSDGTLAVVHLRSRRRFRLDLGRLLGEAVRASWYDPTSGELTETARSPFPSGSRPRIRSPGPNRAGDSDWLLVLEALDVPTSPASGAVARTGSPSPRAGP